MTPIPEGNVCVCARARVSGLSSMSVEARLLFSPLRPLNCPHIRCNRSVRLRFRQSVVRSCANGVSRPVHSESCCQGIRRKQVGNVPAAGRRQSESRWLWFSKDMDRNGVKLRINRNTSVHYGPRWPLMLLDRFHLPGREDWFAFGYATE